MGNFTVPLQVASLGGQQFIGVEALVDTGSTYTSLPRDTLTALGVEQEEDRGFELANNQIVEYPVGQARIRLEGREFIALVVFAPEDTAPLLGMTTLETFGLGVDPVGQKLVPVTALMKQSCLAFTASGAPKPPVLLAQPNQRPEPGTQVLGDQWRYMAVPRD